MLIEWLASGPENTWQEGAGGLVSGGRVHGGRVYGAEVRRALAERHRLELSYLRRGAARSRLRRVGEWLSAIGRAGRLTYTGDVVIRDPFTTCFAPFDKGRRHVVLVYHLETDRTPYPTLYKYLNRRFCRRARLAHRVVVLSQHWRERLEREGVERVEVIPNGFDLRGFALDRRELERFRGEHDLCATRPLIYLGNARSEKGFEEAYRSLAGLDATFVVSGSDEVEPPIVGLDLDYRDYLKLLGVSDLAITMSTFDEGWCRTAHEAMLCGTPVVGSGRGGMGELLAGGGQVICPSFADLPEVVNALLRDSNRRRAMAERGRAFATRFDRESFDRRWRDLIENLAESRPQASEGPRSV